MVVRDYNFFNHDEFENDISKFKWEDVLTSHDVLIVSSKYILDQHAPIK